MTSHFLPIAAAALALVALPARAQTASGTTTQVSGLDEYFAEWGARVAEARATQPSWSSPIVTTTSLMEERVRFDVQQQEAGNGTHTTDIDGGKGVDLIVGDNQEIQIAAPPYLVRGSDISRKGDLSAFGDWSVFRFKERLLSSPSSKDDYIVSAWLQLQVPTGSGKLTSHAVTLLPTLGFGKGFGKFVIQGTVGGSLPTGHVDKIGDSVLGNIAFQYHALGVFWPQLEVNWTYYADGPRGGLSQVYLTPGVVVGRIPITKGFKLTIGIGYQSAVAPSYRAKPLLPSYNHAVIATTRISF